MKRLSLSDFRKALMGVGLEPISEYLAQEYKLPEISELPKIFSRWRSWFYEYQLSYGLSFCCYHYAIMFKSAVLSCGFNACALTYGDKKPSWTDEEIPHAFNLIAVWNGTEAEVLLVDPTQNACPPALGPLEGTTFKTRNELWKIRRCEW